MVRLKGIDLKISTKTSVRHIFFPPFLFSLFFCHLFPKKINNITLNIGGGPKNTISLKDLTFMCQQITNNKIKIGSISKTSIFDIPYYVTDNYKLKKFYKWSPRKNTNQIIKDIYIWLTKNKMVLKYFK